MNTVPLALARQGEPDSTVEPRLRVSLLLYHRDRVEVVLMRPGIGVIVGREPPADIVVQDSSLSRRHACFTLLDGQVFVEDLSSLNGTHLGALRITRSAARAGDTVTLGAVTALVHVHTGEDDAHGTASHQESEQAAAERARVLVSAADIAAAGPDDDAAPLAASPSMRALFETAARLGRSVIPILLCGETGTGKEVLAKLIHDAGPRRAKPMVCVNCGAIPADLRESILFGHLKGAFTGASTDRAGVFESAHGGSVLLDEIGELSPGAQTALLRVLETKRVTRVGSNHEVETDVRIIAATHRDLYAMCEAGTFRQDLFYRLDAMTLTLPPLRERREDIGPLAARFLRRANQRNEREVERIDAEALGKLEAYPWPGNVRELRNAVERAVVIARGNVITVEDLPDRVRAAAHRVALSASDEPGRASPLPADRSEEDSPPPEDYAAQMIRLEATMLVEALRDTGWNQTQAARRLKMPLRTLQHKIKVLGLKKPTPSA